MENLRSDGKRSTAASFFSGGGMFRRGVRFLGQGVLDLLFPRVCPLCGKPSDRRERLVCWSCFSKLPTVSADRPRCVTCGKVPEGAVDRDFLCEACRKEPPAFDRARHALPFRFETRELIHTFKYRRATWLVEDLTDLLEGCVRVHYDIGAIDWILPVPLHAVKYLQRTYNQAEYLSASLARRTGVAFSNALLERRRPTPTQTHLGARARRENVRGAFVAVRPEEVRGRTILLVDDVMTTGATLSAVAAALKKAGAWRVWAATIARG